MFQSSAVVGFIFLFAGLSIAVYEMTSSRQNTMGYRVATPMIGGSMIQPKNGPWHKCVSMQRKRCAELIKMVNKDIEIEYVSFGASVTDDFRMDRVRIFYDENDLTVVEAPHLG